MRNLNNINSLNKVQRSFNGKMTEFMFQALSNIVDANI